jgi:hypothetical protein
MKTSRHSSMQTVSLIILTNLVATDVSQIRPELETIYDPY